MKTRITMAMLGAAAAGIFLMPAEAAAAPASNEAAVILNMSNNGNGAFSGNGNGALSGNANGALSGNANGAANGAGSGNIIRINLNTILNKVLHFGS